MVTTLIKYALTMCFRNIFDGCCSYFGDSLGMRLEWFKARGLRKSDLLMAYGSSVTAMDFFNKYI